MVQSSHFFILPYLSVTHYQMYSYCNIIERSKHIQLIVQLSPSFINSTLCLSPLAWSMFSCTLSVLQTLFNKPNHTLASEDPTHKEWPAWGRHWFVITENRCNSRVLDNIDRRTVTRARYQETDWYPTYLGQRVPNSLQSIAVCTNWVTDHWW